MLRCWKSPFGKVGRIFYGRANHLAQIYKYHLIKDFQTVRDMYLYKL